jgi:hypothetical protein
VATFTFWPLPVRTPIYHWIGGWEVESLWTSQYAEEFLLLLVTEFQKSTHCLSLYWLSYPGPQKCEVSLVGKNYT